MIKEGSLLGGLRARALAALLLFAAGGLLAIPPAAAGAETGAGSRVVLRVGQVLDFRQLKGRQSWQTRAFNRVRNAVWVFHDNGTFAFNTTDVRTDLYPLRGRYRVSGNRVTFNANGAVRIGGSSAFTELIGRIDFGRQSAVMTLDWANGAGYGAVINNQRFGSTASSHYRVQLTVVNG
jgi:hypothetical protein